MPTRREMLAMSATAAAGVMLPSASPAATTDVTKSTVNAAAG